MRFVISNFPLGITRRRRSRRKVEEGSSQLGLSSALQENRKKRVKKKKLNHRAQRRRCSPEPSRKWRYADLCAVEGPLRCLPPLGSTTPLNPTVSPRAPAPCRRVTFTWSRAGVDGVRGAGRRGRLFRYQH